MAVAADVVEPDLLERSAGKAQRVIDLRRAGAVDSSIRVADELAGTASGNRPPQGFRGSRWSLRSLGPPVRRTGVRPRSGPASALNTSRSPGWGRINARRENATRVR